MKKQLLYLFTLSILGVNAQKLTPIDALSIGMNYSLPEATFSTHSTDEKVISQHTESKVGYSLGIMNTLRKTKPFQFIYGVQLNYLSIAYAVDYETTLFNPNDAIFQKHVIIPDYIQGELNSMMITLPLLFRLNLKNTNSKLPIFFDTGIKYDFITAYYTKYIMKQHEFDPNTYSYTKKIVDDNSRFYNKRYNLNLTFGIGTLLKRVALKLSYTYSIFDLETKILNHYGNGNAKMNYLNFSVNYKLRK